MTDNKNRSIETLLDSAIQLILDGSGDYDQAIADCTTVIKSADATPEQALLACAHRAWGYTKLPAPKWSDALADCIKVIDSPEATSEALVTALGCRGYCYAKSTPPKLKKAIADFSEVIGIEDAPVEQKAIAHFNRSYAYSLLEPPEKELEIADFSAVINMKKASVDYKVHALINRGIIYRQLGSLKLKDAIADFTEVINTNDVTDQLKEDALINRGVTYSQLTPPESGKAIKDFTAILSKDSASDERKGYAFFLRALSYEVMGQYKKALDDMQEAKKLGDSDADYYIDTYTQALVNKQAGMALALSEKIKDLLRFKGTSITHYTSFKTARTLLISDEAGPKLFRLTNAVHLKDPSEGNAILDYLCPHKEKDNGEVSVSRKIANVQFFVGSFVPESNADDLTLWRMYGKEKQEEAAGCSITFNAQFVAKEKKSSKEEVPVESELFRVAYMAADDFFVDGKKSAELKTLFEGLRTVVADMPRNTLNEATFLNEIRYLVKLSPHRHESECRLVIHKMASSEDIQWDLDETPPKSYIEIPKAPCLYVEKIILGPKVPNAVEWATAFKIMSDQFRKDGTPLDVQVSQIPYNNMLLFSEGALPGAGLMNRVQ